MGKRTRGQYFEVVDGVHKGKHAVMLYKDQLPEITAAKKICVMVVEPHNYLEMDNRVHREDSPDKILIEPTFLKRIGFID